MTEIDSSFYETVGALGDTIGDPIPVTMSPELIGLLSDQLYRSPSKAIEELVINGFDAEASEARVCVPEPSTDIEYIVVYDNGHGMTYEGLSDLWKVGRPKMRDDTMFERKQRKQIGKFGIGKLATYAVAHRATYVTKTDDQYLVLTINYGAFTSNPEASTTRVELDVHRVSDLEGLWSRERFRDCVAALGLSRQSMAETSSWTIVILEELKTKAQTMGLGRLRRVLRTAMPLSSKFRIFLNGGEIESSKEDYDVVVDFDVSDLPAHRLRSLAQKTGEQWSVEDGKLLSPKFPSGITGQAKVTRQTLVGKSSDLFRSEGFFVFVRGRLVNEDDARFGLHELSHATLNRFRADINADDLDAIITANRESMEDVDLYRHAQAALNEIFNEARQRYEELPSPGENNDRTREDQRNWVPERLVEYPTADAIASYARSSEGSEADDSWMYLSVDSGSDVAELAATLYATPREQKQYTYRYVAKGRAGRMVEFDPGGATFTINQDHELVAAYISDPSTEVLIQDIVTAEALLEVYLRDAGMKPHAIGEVLERRDLLLRGLADSHMFSVQALGAFVRDSSNRDLDLEIAVVAGARALGFVAKHISGSGEPDGIARFTDFPGGEQKITLEAKSSASTPSAKDIDFASLDLHVRDQEAKGCLLVAPNYAGDDDGNAARSAKNMKISCWTVDQFARVIESVEDRHISARRVLEIVTAKFAPGDVEEAVNELLADPTWEPRALYIAIVQALRNTGHLLTQSPRTTTLIASEVARMEGFEGVEEADIERAVSDIAGASRGALLLRDEGVIVLNVDLDELERRVQALTRTASSPRRLGAFGVSDESSSG